MNSTISRTLNFSSLSHLASGPWPLASIAWLLASAAPTFAGWSVGPDYQRPPVTTPPAYRYAPAQATSSQAVATSDAWWEAFNDPALTAVIERSLQHNQDLRAALARLQQARAAAGLARSDYLPAVAIQASGERTRTSTTTDNIAPVAQATTLRLPLELSWELDLFGRVRRLNEAARADVTAARSALQAAQLSLTAEIATTYYALRAAIAETSLLRRTVASRGDAWKIAKARYENGAAAEFDTVRAESDLATAEAELAAAESRRASLEHALALLSGSSQVEGSASFVALEQPKLPGIPLGLPATLLDRRPDIAAAEHAVIAASARIGVAKAAFFPTLSLNGGAGFASAVLSTLLISDSRVWSIGPSLYIPLFQGGRIRSNLARARALHEEAVAAFHQRALIALREVHDALAANHFLALQAQAQARAMAGAQRALALAENRYRSGITGYLEVADSQRTALTAERAQLHVTVQQTLARIGLIKALGGAWHAPRHERSL